MPSPRDPTIRHAGRAHIRGKIRRVWRPRYLEVCDSGLVRYYELPPTADVTLPEDSDWDHVNMIPKDTLIIYHARIIDVTTLRDLHVGLPKGSFGVLFKGQRLLHLELAQTNEPNPPREYFCAVSTLEEAQTWVIVLQWAASVCKTKYPVHSLPHLPQHLVLGVEEGSHSSTPHSTRGGERGGKAINFLGDSCHIPSGARIPSVTDQNGSLPPLISAPDQSTTTTPPTKQGNSPLDLEREGAAAVVAEASDIFMEPRKLESTKSHRRPKASVGRIVVTKVHGYQFRKRTKAGGGILEWEVAYEIALLLLQGTKVEERRILRTAADLKGLLDQLAIEVDSKISLTLINEWKPKLWAQDLPEGLDEVLDLKYMIHTFAFVDRMLRALAMDANIVNSKALKSCFVLDLEDPPVVAARWYKSKKDHTITFQKIQIVSEDETDSFVKAWLSKRHSPSLGPTEITASSQMSLWMLQRPWMVLGSAGLGLALSVPLAKVYQQMMVSVTLRLDLLVGSWCLAAYLGKQYLVVLGGGSGRASTPLHRTRRSLPPKPVVVSSIRPPIGAKRLKSTVVIKAPTSAGEEVDDTSVDSKDDLDYVEQDEEEDVASLLVSKLSSPLPQYPHNNGESCWSIPPDIQIFRVRGVNYLEDRIKIPSGPAPLVCRGVDVWLTDNPERHIARHPSVLNGKLNEEDTFLVNFLLPFGNFVSYFTVPPLSEFPDKLAKVWTKFLQGDQQYRDKRLKLLPVVIDGPWIVKAAVGNGTAPALLGKVIPLQYFFKEPNQETNSKGVYEVDVIITASSIAKGILSVVKGHTKSLTIAFAFIIEAAEQEELPETVLCAFQVHALHLEDCPHLPECNLDEI